MSPVSPTVSIVNLCLGPALPVLPLLVIFAWVRIATLDRLVARFGLRSGRGLRVLIAGIALTGIVLDVLRVASGHFSHEATPIGLVEALYIVTSYPVWFVIAVLGFVNLMAQPFLVEGKQNVAERLGLGAAALWLLIVGVFVVTDPTTVVSWYASFSRYAPLNLMVGTTFAISAGFLIGANLKDRQISLTMLLMIGLFVGMIGMIAMSSSL